MTRCHSWLLIPWCLVTIGPDLFVSASPVAASATRDSIPSSPAEPGGGHWDERCRRAGWDPDSVPKQLRILCRRLGDGAMSSGVDPLEKALREAVIRSGESTEEGAENEEGTKYPREDGSPLKLLQKIRRFAEEEEEDEEEEGETGGKELQSNGGGGGGWGEKNVSGDDGKTRASISPVKRETSSDRQELRGSLFALERYLKSRRGYERKTRNKDAQGSRSTNGPRMSLYFIG